jgi:hypothetical protein
MSINKRFLPEKKELQLFLKENGSHKFYERFLKKTDVMVGPSLSHEFIDEFMIYYQKGNTPVFYQIPQLKLFEV